jgi:cobaltochelatase CobN
VIELGKRGTLEWLPGQALALSSECSPGAMLGPIPRLRPFIVNEPGVGSEADPRTGQ